MNLSQERQGYIGDLTTKSLPELKDLLARKEKLLSDRVLLQKLPDKGRKIHEFVMKVKELIDKRSETSVFDTDKSSDDANMPHRVPVIELAVASMREEQIDRDSELSSTTIHKFAPEKTDLLSLSDELLKMSLGTTMETFQTGQPSVNTYEKVIQRDNDTLEKEFLKFMPHRSLKPKDKPFVRKETSQTKMESRVYDESAVHPPQYIHQKSKLIPLHESVRLMEEQQRKNEELAIERATMRLLKQSSAKMEVYHPASTDMNYREPDRLEQVDLDSDDDCDDES